MVPSSTSSDAIHTDFAAKISRCETTIDALTSEMREVRDTVRELTQLKNQARGVLAFLLLFFTGGFVSVHWIVRATVTDVLLQHGFFVSRSNVTTPTSAPSPPHP